MLGFTKEGDELMEKLFGDTEVIDVIEADSIPDVLKAESKGKNTLILRKIPPIRRVDGKMACRALEHRWHNMEITADNINDICSVQGNDYTYWQAKELDLTKSLFDQVNLF